MTKYSRQKMDEISDKHSDNAQRRTKPEDQGPASPKKIADIYAKGKQEDLSTDEIAKLKRKTMP